jgi:hypothetical protein
MTRRLEIVIVLLGLSIIVVVATMSKNASRKREMSHAVTWTKSALAMICNAINSIEIVKPSVFSRQTITNVDSRSLYWILSSTNSGVRVLTSREDWESKRDLVDAWGNPFKVEAKFMDATNHSLIRIRLWSGGANGIDEDGGGDDISIGPCDLNLE